VAKFRPGLGAGAGGGANDTCDRLGELPRVARRRCRKLAADTATVYGAVGFRWAVNPEA
jgi:hypothetical protein